MHTSKLIDSVEELEPFLIGCWHSIECFRKFKLALPYLSRYLSIGFVFQDEIGFKISLTAQSHQAEAKGWDLWAILAQCTGFYLGWHLSQEFFSYCRRRRMGMMRGRKLSQRIKAVEQRRREVRKMKILIYKSVSVTAG